MGWESDRQLLVFYGGLVRGEMSGGKCPRTILYTYMCEQINLNTTIWKWIQQQTQKHFTCNIHDRIINQRIAAINHRQYQTLFLMLGYRCNLPKKAQGWKYGWIQISVTSHTKIKKRYETDNCELWMNCRVVFFHDLNINWCLKKHKKILNV